MKITMHRNLDPKEDFNLKRSELVNSSFTLVTHEFVTKITTYLGNLRPDINYVDLSEH